MIITTIKPHHKKAFIAMAKAMHAESRFNQWPFCLDDVITLFTRSLDHKDMFYQGYAIESDQQLVGFMLLKAWKRSCVEVWEVMDDAFYILPEFRGKKGLHLLVDQAQSWAKELRSVLNQPVQLYLCPNASDYASNIAKALESMNGKTVGYCVKMEI